MSNLIFIELKILIWFTFLFSKCTCHIRQTAMHKSLLSCGKVKTWDAQTCVFCVLEKDTLQAYRLLFTRSGVLEDVLDLEDTFWCPWPWLRSLKFSKIALFSARGQHYFLNSWNFVGKRLKPRGKLASTLLVFLTWSIGVAKGGGGALGLEPSPAELKFHQKRILFLQFQFLFSIFCLQQ